MRVNAKNITFVLMGVFGLFVFAIICALISDGAFTLGMAHKNPAKELYVEITGDVKTPLLTVIADKADLKKIKKAGKSIEVIHAQDLIEKAVPVFPEKVFLVGRDGLTAELKYEDLKGSFFAVENGGINFITDHFPVNTQVKGIEKIIVKGRIEPYQNRDIKGVAVIQEDKLYFKSLGELMTLPSEHLLKKVGESIKTMEGRDYKGVIYQWRKIVSISNILNKPAEEIAVYTADGDIIYTDANSGLQINPADKMVLYGTAVQVKNPIGIVADPPAAMVTDIAEKILEKVKKGHRVMVIYIDGLGYQMYKKAVSQNYIPFIRSLGEAEKALTVYPPITDVTFTSMVTGKTPKYTGIRNRQDSDLMCDTVFDKLARLGKKSMVIEGNIKILNNEEPTSLNIDENNDGTADDEIFNSALKEIKNPRDILVVHFHSYDDAGHRYGPDSDKALEKLKKIDEWSKELVDGWEGDVIITADHGMHGEGSGGGHGIFCPEDLFIPIIYAP